MRSSMPTTFVPVRALGGPNGRYSQQLAGLRSAIGTKIVEGSREQIRACPFLADVRIEPSLPHETDDFMAIDQTRETASAAPPLPLAGRLALGGEHVLACFCLAILFIYLNHVPLFHTDLWGHVAYGQWIVEHGRLPAEDPFVDLAEGVPLVDSAWLGQVIFAGVESWRGAEGLSNLYALVVTATYLLLGWAFCVKTRSVPAGIVGSGLVLLLAATRIAIMRTEVLGTLSFAVVILLVCLATRGGNTAGQPDGEGTTPAPSRALTRWLIGGGLPLLFLFWANVHGSFVVGLAFLGCHAAGRFVEALWLTKSPAAALEDRAFRFWLVMIEVSAAATLLNPYGMDLLVNAVTFPGNPNLDAVLEWKKLSLISAEGILFGVSWVLLPVALRFSRRRVRPTDVLLLVVFNAAVIGSVRMIGWYAVAYVYVMLPHMTDAATRLNPLRATGDTDGIPRQIRQFLAVRTCVRTALCVLLLWLGFALSPTGNLALGGEPRPADKLYSDATPRGLTRFFRENPPQGQIWNPQWWGDWLVWDGPPELQVFMTTNAVHVAPHRVWEDYLRVARARSGWTNVLERYRVSTLVIHKQMQEGLNDRARALQGWEVVYEDDTALVLSRNRQTDNAENGATLNSKTSTNPEPVRATNDVGRHQQNGE